MPRMTLAWAVVLAVLVGCRDGPIGELPVEPQRPVEVQSTAQTDAILSIQQMLDDPLVLEIVAALGDQSVTYGFDDIRGELNRLSVHGDVLAMHQRLMTTRDFLASDTEDPNIVLRDVLRLVLDDAEMMLVGNAGVAAPEEVERDRVEHGERVKH